MYFYLKKNYDKPEAIHFRSTITEWSVAIGRSSQVEVSKLLQISPHHLVSVDKYDFLYIEREEDVKEQNLVAPNDSLLLSLLVQPPGPLVLDQAKLEAILLSHVRQEIL